MWTVRRVAAAVLLSSLLIWLDRPLDRSGLGGVAAALVTGAPCSVEVVR